MTCCFLVFESFSSFFFSVNHFTARKTFNIFHVDRDFNLEHINTKAVVRKNFHGFVNFVRFYFGKCCACIVSDVFIISQNLKEEWYIFSFTFGTNAFDISLFLKINVFITINIIIKQEFHCISSFFFKTFSRPFDQAIWQAASRCRIITCFFISKQKSSIRITNLTCWQTILRVKKNR